MAVRVTRLPLRVTPDPNRVITRFFCPGDRLRAQDIIRRVLAYTEPEVSQLLAEVEGGFRAKHPDLIEILADHFDQVRADVLGAAALSRERQLLIGACFTMEYAVEAVALFNPSIVPAIRQEGVSPGSLRFLMSLRATGEGHVSSIVFRVGEIDAQGDIRIETPPIYTRPLKASGPERFAKSIFLRDLAAVGVSDGHVDRILDRLDDVFTREQLAHAIEWARQNQQTSGFLEENADTLISLTRVNYSLRVAGPTIFREFEIVVFPFSDIERHGIEDLRLVRFTEDDGSQTYYGTFTAYNGVRVFPQLLEFHGGTEINISLITGECAKNKGMALFPRRVHGKYAMISRMDNENLYYMESDDVRLWTQARLLQQPKFPWQVIQIGNCGSPLETDRGWLLLTHGVGPMRQYCIGATLLDRDDPCRLIGQTREPLLVANDEERSGYVPNVVYTCGALIHNGILIMPYAVSDSSTCIARIDLGELLSSLDRGTI
ncbi:MAG: glycoside hydrolase family 130 protein [Isosphaeraceae bacterium]